VSVPGPGRLELAGKGLKPVTTQVAKRALAASQVTLTLKAKGKTKKKLKRKGKAKVTAEVTFTPTGGSANTDERKLKLVKK